MATYLGAVENAQIASVWPGKGRENRQRVFFTLFMTTVSLQKT
jgi:hypothetical protein